IAHGLMVISALELMSEREDRTLFWMGLACFVMVVLKSAFEAFSGRMLFTFLDFGMVGYPVAVTHAGGVLGGLLCWVVISGAFRGILSGVRSQIATRVCGDTKGDDFTPGPLRTGT